MGMAAGVRLVAKQIQQRIGTMHNRPPPDEECCRCSTGSRSFLGYRYRLIAWHAVRRRKRSYGPAFTRGLICGPRIEASLSPPISMPRAFLTGHACLLEDWL